VPNFEGDVVAHSVSSTDFGSFDRSVDVVVFELGPLRFALAASAIDELLQAFAFDSLPGAPAVVSGVANLRGLAVPVFDLRLRFGLPKNQLLPGHHFVVARASARRVILHVDRALEFKRLGVFPISEASDLPERAELVTGVAPVEDGILLVYDLAALLSDAEACELDQSLARAPTETAS
jgi:purine-binding chemotaxis protein CheW